MSKKLYIGNLPFGVNAEKLTEIFSHYKPLGEVIIVSFKDTGRSKGFGFVTIENDEHAQKAIDEMNGKEVEGRKITVNEARPFEADRPRRSFSRPRFGGGNRSFDREGGHRGGFSRRSNDRYNSQD